MSKIPKWLARQRLAYHVITTTLLVAAIGGASFFIVTENILLLAILCVFIAVFLLNQKSAEDSH